MFKKAITRIDCIGKRIFILIIRAYRFFISPILGARCRFYPSCSLYAQIAVERFGIFYGGWLVIKRVLRCHPWYHGDGFDPVPELQEKNG